MTAAERPEPPEFAPSGLDTLRPVVAHLLGEYVPVLRETARLFDVWAADEAPETAVPRSLGSAHFRIGGADGRTMARAFSLLRLQQARECC